MLNLLKLSTMQLLRKSNIPINVEEIAFVNNFMFLSRVVSVILFIADLKMLFVST